jgi:hypothetical protein
VVVTPFLDGVFLADIVVVAVDHSFVETQVRENMHFTEVKCQPRVAGAREDRWRDYFAGIVERPNDLRSIMRKAGAVVAGSYALAAIGARYGVPMEWQPGDVDFFVPGGLETASGLLEQHLVRSEGFTLECSASCTHCGGPLAP